MRRFLLRLSLLLVLLCAGGGCTGATSADLVMRDATVSANATASTIETTQSLALLMYRTEQELAITRASDKASAQANVAIVRANWVPVWEALAKCRVAYAALAQLLGAESPAQAAIQAAVNQQSIELTKASNEIALARARIQKGIP